MYCPYCHTLCGSSDHFCHACGTQLQAVSVKKGSRWVPLLLLVLMSTVGLLLFFATAGNNTPVHPTGSTSWFYLQDGVLYFEESRYTGSGELTVPAEISGQAVTALSEDCFAGCKNLTTIYLPDTLTSIGNGAFYECTSLRGIYIPPSVDSIGSEAFYVCTALESICLHNSTTAIGSSAFDQCSHLNYIIFKGTYNQWLRLYDSHINPHVGVFCEDGSFFQPEDSH